MSRRNTDTYIQAAFNEVCAGAKQAERAFVSLYESIPYYGGPEEGGWWGSDTVLRAYKSVPDADTAGHLLEKCKALAEKMGEDSRKRYGQKCADELDYCEARLIDDSNAVFGEVDGPSKFFVVVETRLGSFEHEGDRHYS